MAPELEMGVLGLGMGVLELGLHHHQHHGMQAFSTSSSSSAAYGSCGGGGGGADAYLYALLPTPDSSTALLTGAAAAASFQPVDDLLDFSAKDGLFAAATGDVSCYPFLGHADAAAQRHLLTQQQEPFHAASVYGATAAPDATGNYGLFADHRHHYSSSSAGSDLAAFPDDLYIPSEEAAELEWLSKFVDDSRDVPFHIPGISTAGFAPAAAANSNNTNQYNTNSHATAASAATATPIIARADPTGGVMIPGRARSKRSRVSAPAAGAQLGAASLTWTSSHLASPSSSSSSSSETKQPRAAVNGGKKKRDAVPTVAGAAAGTAAGGLAERGGVGGGVRRCTHCSSDKTPQWRTGPLGPKTLCNACGVRYKSGRLVPEYRPAASPTFILTQHSNSHRKVMELRRQKELIMRHQHQHPHQNQQQHDASPRGIAAAIPVSGVLASTRPDLLLRDFEVC